ncbi:branched-chain amino acid ABC transporter permease/ATP-binding protein [Arthrobacter sulfonylureivorans]|uniref:ATP-binding cassette domain-containing protein n=1 Tax=Arthrobacter sulfonylureivorans TaxID=2486855 RepID=A0ABY3W727_9MICC|nr:branched-chain amino acid ABC transporter permease/ATP-binding protein [Arthrobacter sulfonylureivorans]UNK46075.1 ATP-binding cassette domain-containing protein [Arthrobacter sulfonylureivorans]
MIDVIRFALIGAASGAVIALLGLGVNVVYRTTRVVNFSHAAIAITAAYQYKEFIGSVPWPVALILAIAVGMGIGLLMEVCVVRPLRHASFLTKTISTIGVLLVLQAVLMIRYGYNAVVVPSWLPTTLLNLGPIPVGLDRVLAFGIALVLAAALYWFYSKTRFGIATTAASGSERSLAALGTISPRTVSLVNWLIAGGIAAFAGVMLAPMTSLTPVLALSLIVPILSAALLGNFSSFWLTFLGGTAIGILQAELSVFTSLPGLQETVPFLIIVVLLAARGRGLPQRGEDAERLPVIGTGRIPVLPVVILGVVLLFLLQWGLPVRWVQAVAVGLIAAVILLSVVVVTGYAGQLSLASYALAGVAALVAAHLVANAGWPFLAAGLAGVVATVPVGFLFGLPAVRTRGTNLAIVTLGLAVSFQALILNNPSISNGIDGLKVGQPELFGLNISNAFEPRRYAIMVLIVFVALAIIVLNLRRSGAGRQMIAVRGNERAAASLGISVPRTKLYAFIVSALIAGVGGVLLAFTNSVVTLANPGGQFDATYSLNAIAQSAVGGLGFVSGTIIGTVTVPGAVVDTLLRFITSGAWFNLIGGLLLLITVIAAPSGVAAQIRVPLARLVRVLKLVKDPKPYLFAAEEQAVQPVQTGRLEVRDLSISFSGNKVLDRVNLDVVGGTVLGVIGPNGAGKSTLVDAITGFNRPTGSIALDGRDLTRLGSGVRSLAGLGRSFQSLELFEDLSVFDNLVVAADADAPWHTALFAGVKPGRAELTDAARAAARTLGLHDRINAMPADLSYGERRLLAIARSLASRPKILLLDEPAAGLGAAERHELARLIRVIAEEWNIGVLIIEHDVELVLGVSDSVLALDFGRTIAHGSPEEIRHNDHVVAAYLGTGDTDDSQSGDVRDNKEEVRA